MSAFTPSTYSHPAFNAAPPTKSVSDLMSSNMAAPASVSSGKYMEMCKVVLVRRTKNLLVLTALASVAALHLCTRTMSVTGLFNIVPTLVNAPLAILSVLPILVLRKKTINTSRPPLPTRFAKLNQLRQRSSLYTIPAYLFSSSFLLMAFVGVAGWLSKDARLDFWFFHEGRDAWQLNERRVLLALLHTFLGIFGMAWHVLNNRSQLTFDDDLSLSIPARLVAKGTKRVQAAFRTSGIAVITFYTFYILLRRPVLRFVLVNFVGGWARPYFWSMMRYNGAYSVTLAARAYSFTLLHFLVWEAVHVCFDVYATQRMNVSQFAPNPNEALLSGLRSTDLYYHTFAYLELAQLTLTDAARRQAIFKDIRAGSTVGGAWSELSRECLLLIGTELQRAKGRGSLPKPASYSSSSSVSSQPQRDSPNSARVMKENVFQPTKPTFFDKLASAAVTSSSSALGSSPAAQAVTRGPAAQEAKQAVSTAIAATSSAVSRVPAILQSSSLAQSKSSLQEGASAPAPLQAMEIPEVLGFEQRVAKFVPAPLRAKLFAVSMESRARRCVPKRRETICAVQALSNLICASLTEDAYGVAQRDIPKILEAFVRYLTVLDALAEELYALAEKTPGGRDERERARRVVETEVGEVQEALRSGAKAVLSEFADYLGEFRFPTAIASQLQLLVDYGG
ncbi:hypothetical protein JCM10207_000958 [Rhodosporidiobolus poonsookiae]